MEPVQFQQLSGPRLLSTLDQNLSSTDFLVACDYSNTLINFSILWSDSAGDYGEWEGKATLLRKP